MLISDSVAKLIYEMLDKGGGIVEIQRNDLACRIGCVPSQINYVIMSRFTPELGYIVESRRGGGGYIRIIRKQLSKNDCLLQLHRSVSDALDESTAAAFTRNLYENRLISAREMQIINAALSSCGSDNIRAAIFRQILLAVME